MTDADLHLGYDLTTTKVTHRDASCGTWNCGTLHGHRFSALVFPEHAEVPDYELNESRISKLWVQSLADRRTVFNWDRGMDIPATDDLVAMIVDFLCVGLADYAYGNKN